MTETIIIYLIVGLFAVGLFAVMYWSAPYLERWGQRMDDAEIERRRPKTPKPPYSPPSQHVKDEP